MRGWGLLSLVVVACSSQPAFELDESVGGAGGGAGETLVAGVAGVGGEERPGGGAGGGPADAIDCSELYDGGYGQDEGEYLHDSETCGDREYCVLRPINPEALSGYEPCAPVPEACPGGGRPVCGQDGKRYENECTMHRARMDFVSYDAQCADDLTGYYRCGRLYCREGSEYCAVRGWQNTWDVDAYDCVASECVAEGGCDCVGELGPHGQTGDEWGSCSDDQPGRVYLRDPYGGHP